MVHLAITSQGLKHALRAVEGSAAPIWCGADAISEADFEILDCASLTRFSYSLEGEGDEVLAGAVETNKEHRPGETIWIDHAIVLSLGAARWRQRSELIGLPGRVAQ